MMPMPRNMPESDPYVSSRDKNKLWYHIYPKYSDTSTPNHAYPSKFEPPGDVSTEMSA